MTSIVATALADEPIVAAIPLGLIVPFAAVFGAIIGSFLNVVVWRVPLGMSIVKPRSKCPRCGAGIAWYDNIPVISWIMLRARCRHCGEPISWQYPLVESFTALAFGLIVWAGFAGLVPLAVLPALLVFMAYSIALSLIDIQQGLLPNAIVLPAYPVIAVLLVLASWATGDWSALLHASIGGAALFAFFFVVWFVYPAGMGYGDVKLAGLLGLMLGWFGWAPLLVGSFAGFLIGAVVGVIVMIARRTGRKTSIPFGPSLLAGVWVGIFLGAAIGQWYLQLFGIA